MTMPRILPGQSIFRALPLCCFSVFRGLTDVLVSPRERLRGAVVGRPRDRDRGWCLGPWWRQSRMRGITNTNYGKGTWAADQMQAERWGNLSKCHA